MQSLKQQLRAHLLRRKNLRRVRQFTQELAQGGPPIFILANPADLHFAPLALAFRSPYHRQIFVGNGLSDADVEWLQERCPGTPILQLSGSLSGNTASYLPHGELVNLIALGFQEPFFIQDADCFPLNADVFAQLRLPSDQEYASGPFWKECPEWEHILPDTFLVGIRPKSLARTQDRYGIDASIYAKAEGRAEARLFENGLDESWRPELSHDKKYFDTLQLSWILATLDGERFGKIADASSSLHHVGGTSYLTADPAVDLSHWDWWPLNTCYTTLRILAQPDWEPLRYRFRHIYDRHADLTTISQSFPPFVKSKRFQQTNLILKSLEKSAILAAPK